MALSHKLTLLLCALLALVLHSTGQDTTVMPAPNTTTMAPLNSTQTPASLTQMQMAPIFSTSSSMGDLLMPTEVSMPPSSTPIVTSDVVMMTTMLSTSVPVLTSTPAPVSVTPTPTPSPSIMATPTPSMSVTTSSEIVSTSTMESMDVDPTMTPTATTEPTDTTMSTTPSLPPSPPLSEGAIIAIAVVGGLIVLAVLVLVMICCCWCFCKSSGKEEYIVRPYGNVVVRKWDPRTQHDRAGSLGGSFRSNGRNSFARSSISSVGSFLRASIRRLSGKRRSGKGRNMMQEDEVAMKVTPL